MDEKPTALGKRLITKRPSLVNSLNEIEYPIRVHNHPNAEKPTNDPRS
jgi:hypothetical protein